MRAYVELLRVRHWAKNLAVLSTLPFGLIQHGTRCLPGMAGAFIAFCLVSSAAYAFNDAIDRAEDALHPSKRSRPVARGALRPQAALSCAGALLILAVATAALTGIRGLWLLVTAYIALMVVYSLWLKQQLIVDVIIIALGFVIRTAAGALAIDVYVSPWLLVCTFTLCLFLGFGKRRNEIFMLQGSPAALQHRRTLAHYSPDLLNQLLSTSAGIALLTFLLYIMDRDIETMFDKQLLLYTFPLAVYGVFRYATLIETTAAAGPLDLILGDRALLGTVLVWMAACGFIVLYRPLVAHLGMGSD
jgi:4-hydroxybenzoate polyprenyltransferase